MTPRGPEYWGLATIEKIFYNVLGEPRATVSWIYIADPEDTLINLPRAPWTSEELIKFRGTQLIM